MIQIGIPVLPPDTEGCDEFELLNFKEINEGFYALIDTPLRANLKKGEIYYIELGSITANSVKTLAQYIKDTLTREEVEELMNNLRR